MKKILIALGLLQALHASEAEVFEGREGFHFAAGMTAGVIEIHPYMVPLLSLDLGYNFTETFALNMTMKTILMVNFVGLEAKLYDKESSDTWFVTTAVNREYIIADGPIENMYGAGVGYAVKNVELELSAMGRKGKAAGFLTYKYIW